MGLLPVMPFNASEQEQVQHDKGTVVEQVWNDIIPVFCVVLYISTFFICLYSFF